MRFLLRFFRFVIFELWRWIIVILAGALGACVGIWSAAKFGFLRELPNPSIAGFVLDKFVVVGLLVCCSLTVLTWWCIIKPIRVSDASNVGRLKHPKLFCEKEN